jgi:hypothetical protein
MRKKLQLHRSFRLRHVTVAYSFTFCKREGPVFAAYSFILPLARLNSNFLFLPPPRSLPAPHRFAPNRLHRTPCRSTASPSATRPHFESEMKNLASSDVEPLLTPTLTGSTTIKSPGMWFSSPVKASPSTRTRGFSPQDVATFVVAPPSASTNTISQNNKSS